MKGYTLVKIKMSKKISDREITKRLKKFKEENKDVVDSMEFTHFPWEHPLII